MKISYLNSTDTEKIFAQSQFSNEEAGLQALKEMKHVEDYSTFEEIFAAEMELSLIFSLQSPSIHLQVSWRVQLWILRS